MLSCSWDMAHDKCNYFSFWAFFCPFTPPPPLTTPKMKMKKKWKKKICLEISSLNSVPKMWLYAILFLRYCMWRINCHFSFWAIFCPFIPLKTSKFQKNEKNAWRYHFTQLYQKSWSYAILFLDMACSRCNYCSFWLTFHPFTPLTTQKIETSKQMKKPILFLRYGTWQI